MPEKWPSVGELGSKWVRGVVYVLQVQVVKVLAIAVVVCVYMYI